MYILIDVPNKISKQIFTTREKSCFLKSLDAHSREPQLVKIIFMSHMNFYVSLQRLIYHRKFRKYPVRMKNYVLEFRF